jgi:regulator of sigma E protease
VSTVLGIVIGIVGLGFLVLVHELGHFMVAKATGMRVEEFSLGFGPYLVKKRWGETVYGISAVPLGGYVRVTGMHKQEFEERVADLREAEAQEATIRSEAAEAQAFAESDAKANVSGGETAPGRKSGRVRRSRDVEDALAGKRALTADEIAATPLERRYYSHPLWHKLLFIVAGVVMNAIVALALLYIVGVVDGESWRSTVVGEIVVGGGAEDAGMLAGDRIMSIDGRQVDRFDELQIETLKHKGETVTLEVQRSGSASLLTMEVQVSAGADGLGHMGILSTETLEHRDISALGGFAYAGRQAGRLVGVIFDGIGMMFTRDVPVMGANGVAGPVGIVQMSQQAVESGFTTYLWFVAMISINLALLNMLPLLPLDGGHFVYAIAERITGRTLSLKVFERVSLVGFALFLLLFLVAAYNDIGRIFTGA